MKKIKIRWLKVKRSGGTVYEVESGERRKEKKEERDQRFVCVYLFAAYRKKQTSSEATPARINRCRETKKKQVESRRGELWGMRMRENSAHAKADATWKLPPSSSCRPRQAAVLHGQVRGPARLAATSPPRHQLPQCRRSRGIAVVVVVVRLTEHHLRAAAVDDRGRW